MIAIQNGHLDVVTTLVEAGATVIDKDDIHVCTLLFSNTCTCTCKCTQCCIF